MFLLMEIHFVASNVSPHGFIKRTDRAKGLQTAGNSSFVKTLRRFSYIVGAGVA